MTTLDGGSQPVALGGGYSIRAPGMTGSANLAPARTLSGNTRTRSAAQESTALDSALAAQDMLDVGTIDVTVAGNVGAPAGSKLRAPSGEDAMELEVPAPKAGNDVVVLAVDEAGAITWHYPLTDSNAIAPAVTRGTGKTVKFRIPSASATPPTKGAPITRSLFSVAGRKILKVLVYPVTDMLVGSLAETFAGKWESGKRPYRFRTVTPDNYNLPTAASIAPNDAEWKRLASGRSLLFIHGTFSSTHGGFGGLDRTDIEALSAAYDGRLYAFDHFTLSHSPEQNINEFVARLPNGVALDSDIVCHSRGGLVAREIAERSVEHGLDNRLKVGKVVFVGVPNAGTLLTLPDHMTNMIDRMTTAVDVLPDGVAAWTLEGIITAVKIIGHGGLNSLVGLMSMNPNGKYLATLGAPNTNNVAYRGIAANFDAKGTSFGKVALKMFAQNKLMDRFFEDAENDLVVPTAGVAGGTGSRFPIADSNMLLLDGSAGVTHTTYFSNQKVREQLRAWLVP